MMHVPWLVVGAVTIISRSYVLCELGEVLLAHRSVLADHRPGPPPPQAEHGTRDDTEADDQPPRRAEALRKPSVTVVASTPLWLERVGGCASGWLRWRR